MNTASLHNETSTKPLVSVIIGFKDRGLGRLGLCIESIHESLAEVDHEVIIADYGSADTDAITDLARKASAHHEIIATDGEWSAARARNAGVRASAGGIILAADADMLFTPKSLHRVTEQLERHPQEVVILQCRDLPVGYSDDVVRQEGLDWERFAALGQLRPRWGVGGLVGLRRSVWERLRGWDERMHTYGGEDTDFAKRVRRAGARIDWLDEPGVAMYHMWHPSATFTAARDAATKAAVEANRAIHTKDETFARNRVKYRYLPARLTPLVSIIFEPGPIRGADIRSALASVLTQTVGDIEVLLPRTMQVGGLTDPRVRSIDSAEGIPRGTFTIAITPQEIWAEDRLEHLLNHSSYGVGLISDRTSLRIIDGQGKTLKGAHVPHPANVTTQGTLLRTALIPADYHYSASWASAITAVAATSATWVTLPWSRHLVTATPQIEEQIVNTWAIDTRFFRDALTRAGLEFPSIDESVPLKLTPLFTAAVEGRPVRVKVAVPNTVALEDWLTTQDSGEAWDWEIVGTREGAQLWQQATLVSTDMLKIAAVLRELRQLGAEVQVSLVTGAATPQHTPESLLATLIDHAEHVYGTGQLPSFWLSISCTSEDVGALTGAMRSLTAVNAAVDRTISTPGETLSYVFAHLRATDRSTALRIAAGPHVPEGVVLVERLSAPLTAGEKS
ncbi:glycosyltransferase family 2 protein [Brachybacterium sp. UNK5269]|uniref:glycosyltransferase family 2 protein n=1 Tax=Brachybacterium sp. UNK5269 TaxID=3408576 RepID=UPI003BB018A0